MEVLAVSCALILDVGTFINKSTFIVMGQPNLLRHRLLLIVVMLCCFYSCEAKTKSVSPDVHLVASTPGDEQIKSLLAIPPETKVDFIRWKLTLKNAEADTQMFLLNITYGQSQPNTTGFVNGGENKSIEGEYFISREKGRINGEIYHLKSAKPATEILMVKLSDNIFHLLTPQKKLMVGNGGWSYTLSRKERVNSGSADSVSLTILSGLPEDTSRQIIFEGRTPCLDFAEENNLTVASGCFKLKWKLILNKDPKTLQPTTYILRRTNSRESDLTGKWTIIKGIPSNRKAVIYQLDPDKPGQSISLLMADENVAFFLHKNNQLFTGNEDFSYTLNKRQKD